MNENIDLCEILKDAPAGTTLWSSVLGECRLVKVYTNPDITYPIEVEHGCNGDDSFTKDGRLYNDLPGECVLFPSHDQRDWSKFQVPKSEPVREEVILYPFDRVLVRDNEKDEWIPEFFRRKTDEVFLYYTIDFGPYGYCIPYNEETKHLTFTTQAPDKEYIIIDGLAKQRDADNTNQ